MAGRHHSQSLSSSRSRVNSNSSSYFAERDSSRDYSYRDRDHHDVRDPYHSKDKDRDKLHDRDSDRHRDKDRERDRDRDRDRGRYRQDEADLNRAAMDRPSSGATSSKGGGSLRLSRSLSSEDSPDSSSSLSGQGEKDTEREPGELSSGSRSEEAGDGAVAGQRSSGQMSSKRSQHHQGSNDGDASKGDSPSSAAVPKKRKFSPIVWDLDEKPNSQKGSSISSTSGVSLSRASPAKSRHLPSPPLPPPPPSASLSPQLPLPPPPPLPVTRSATPKHSTPPSNVVRGTPPISSSGRSSTPPFAGVNISAARALHLPSSKAAALPKTSESSRSFTPSPPSPKHTHYSDSSTDKDEKEADTQMNNSYTQDGPLLGQLFDTPPQVDEAEMGPVPRINIAASRWAEETASPSEGRSPYTSIGKAKARHPHSSESDEGHLSSDENGGRQASENSMSPEPGEYVKDKFENLAEGSGGNKELDVRLDEQYDRELNERELMDIDDEAEPDEEEEEHPEVDSEEEEPPPVPPAPPQRTINMLQGCRSVDEFEKLNKIDEGTYGVVYRARNKKTGEIVALKKVKMEKEREGFPMTSLREINVLLSIHHPSVVDVKEVVVGSNLDSIYMVMEYMEHDLKGLMETIKQPFSQSEVKCLMLQLFEGVKYLHDNWVLHRDLKTSNLLLNNRGELKICDFGLARQYGSPLKTYTHMVVTLWYRAPELLLGAKQYSTAVDMWSLGCIMAEFLAKEPLFNGKSEVDQLDKIFKILGTPNETIWPDFAKLPGVKCNFVRQPFNRLREKFPPTAFAGRPPLSESGFNLLNRLLLYDPKKRITAEEALNHEWFKEVPLPKMKELMPTYPARSEHERRSRRLMKSPDPLAEQRKRELRQAELGAGGLFG